MLLKFVDEIVCYTFALYKIAIIDYKHTFKLSISAEVTRLDDWDINLHFEKSRRLASRKFLKKWPADRHAH